jgi:hypothetical protein
MLRRNEGLMENNFLRHRKPVVYFRKFGRRVQICLERSVRTA